MGCPEVEEQIREAQLRDVRRQGRDPRVAEDQAVWSSLLRRRHQVLVGDLDPYLTMLPSAALPGGGGGRPTSPRGRHCWKQLYRECEAEWRAHRLCTISSDRKLRHVRWLHAAWQSRNRPAWCAGEGRGAAFVNALLVLRLAYSGHVWTGLATLSAACAVAALWLAMAVGAAAWLGGFASTSSV